MFGFEFYNLSDGKVAPSFHESIKPCTLTYWQNSLLQKSLTGISDDEIYLVFSTVWQNDHEQ